jgi:hemolysin D
MAPGQKLNIQPRPGAPTEKPPVATAFAPPRRAEDREFLSAALELLVSPPSPIATALLLTICALFASALAWSYFGWIDIHAVAQGKIQPSGRSKVVQPLEAGKIVAIRVVNGGRVNGGDVLLELDPTEAFADRDAQAHDLEAARGETARRRTAIAIARSETLQPLPITFSAGVGQDVRQRESDVLVADLVQLKSSVASLKAQLAEKLATKDRLSATIAAREKLIALAKERVDMREDLDAHGSGSRALVIDALQQYETQVTNNVGDRGQLLETEAATRSLERKLEETVTQFIADQSQKLADIERKRDRLVEELVKAQSKSDRTLLRAPIAGTVQQLAVTTVGQVVAGGQSLLTIVPLDAPIEVEAMIANQDIGFVESGQRAVVKVDAFPFTRYGAIDGRVAEVSRDAVDDRNATNLSDATNAAKTQSGVATQPPKPQNLVFPATIRLMRGSLDIDGKDLALTPGMAVTVEIKTGQRRVIDYLLSPLRQVAAQTARER